MFNLGKFEHQRRSDMRLFILGLAEIELPRLAVVVGEPFDPDAAFLSSFCYYGTMKASAWCFAWRVFRQGVRFISDAAGRLGHLHVSVTLLIGKWAFWRVDRDVVKIGRTQARKLRV